MNSRNTDNAYRKGQNSKTGKWKTVPDPFTLFGKWFGEAKRKAGRNYEAMHLATAGRGGRPSGRMVLLKGFDEAGFVFYTNYGSRKAREIGENSRVALTFYWQALDRQVRIEGRARKVSAAESDAYFNSRPPESRISAVISPQSQVIADLRTLLDPWKRLLEEGDPGKIRRPAHWGGYRVAPDLFEFWQQGEFRLHDRIRYRLEKGQWITDRLAP